MVRAAELRSPFLLGFDEIERALDKVSKGGADGYPPYNVERLEATAGRPERLRITLAVAGFAEGEIEVTEDDGQLRVRGRSQDDQVRDYLYRGIAARQFQRNFLLADGMQVLEAKLACGLLQIDMVRPKPERSVKRINILAND